MIPGASSIPSFVRLLNRLEDWNPNLNFRAEWGTEWKLHIHSKVNARPPLTVVFSSEKFLVQHLQDNAEKYGLNLGQRPVKQTPHLCPACGAIRVLIRGRHPGDNMREVCPTCVVEKLEDLLASLFNHETKAAS